MEQLLFCPGKARTDLLMWIVSKLAASCYPTELDFDSTFSSASTNSASYRLPENDEGWSLTICNFLVCFSLFFLSI